MAGGGELGGVDVDGVAGEGRQGLHLDHGVNLGLARLDDGIGVDLDGDLGGGAPRPAGRGPTGALGADGPLGMPDADLGRRFGRPGRGGG